ncbi:FAD-dependent oxidoreductase [Candidatus Woesearchaeota archaeon]|nr:FAD-dependent oxidoreductase [Candidatus Woesearchaeota archaeon]
MAEKNEYDLMIIGAGAAGLTAGIYAARYSLKAVVIGPEVGGTANLAHDIENWPGFKGPGMELMQKFREHLDSFKIPLSEDNVKEIEKTGETFTVRTEKQTYTGKTVILAMGTKRRKLEVPGEDEFAGKGVSYCATCDGFFYKDKVAGVVGGSDAAATAAQILSQYCSKVYIIYRGEYMRAEPARTKDLEANPKVEFIYRANVTHILGDTALRKVMLDNGKELGLDGLFIEVGGIPITSLAKELGITLAKNGRIAVNAGMATNIPGVFAAGDITTGSNEFNQIVTASAEGSIAALSVFNFVNRREVKYGN